MATETLEDTKPPLQDDDRAKSEIPEKDASSDDAAAKSRDANAGDKDGASDNQEVEEKDAAEEKKEEIDEDEEEEEDEVEEKEKGKGKKSKKDPVTPAPSERPTRERKTVERFSVPSPAKSARSSASKGLIIEKVKFNFLFYLTAYFFGFVRTEVVKCSCFDLLDLFGFQGRGTQLKDIPNGAFSSSHDCSVVSS